MPVGGMGAEGLVPEALQQKGIGEAKVKLCRLGCYTGAARCCISVLVVASA